MSDYDEYRDPDDHTSSYKPIHGIAVVALVFSLFSLLAIAYSPMIFLSFISAGLAIYSIIRISKSDQFVGLRAAQIAMFLAIASATFCSTHLLVRSWYLNRTAYGHARLLGNLIMEGRYAETYEYSIDPPPATAEGNRPRSILPNT